MGVNMNKGYAIVTGASSGIGEEFAYQLAEKGYSIILIARRKAELERISKDIINKHKVKTKVFTCDLSKEQEIKRIIRYVTQIKNIDFLVNCAGFGNKAHFSGIGFSEMDTDKMRDMIMVHVMATTELTKAITPMMIKRNKGYVINVSSVASFVTSAKSNAIYNSTKAYERIFTETLIDELKIKTNKIHAQALCPGLTKTPFFKNYDASYAPSFMWMTKEVVVKKSIHKVIKKSSVFIPGWKNQFMVLLLRCTLTKKIINFFGRKLNIK